MTTFESSPREDRGRSDRSRSTSERRTKRKKRRWEWTITETATPSEAAGSPATKASHPNALDDERDEEGDDS